MAGGVEAGPGGQRPGRRKVPSYTAAERRAHVRAFERSGVSTREYCATQGISTSSLERWRRELGVLERPRVRLPGKRVRFSRRFTADERRAAVEAFLKSGRTRNDFARLWGCSKASLQ